MKGHHEIFTLPDVCLFWRNDPTGNKPDYRPFFYSHETGWTFRLFVRDNLTENSGYSALMTTLLATSFLHKRILPAPVPIGYYQLEGRLERTNAMDRKGWRMVRDTIRHLAGVETFPHGVIVESEFRFVVPRPEGTFNYQFLAPFGEMLNTLVCGCLHRIAFKTSSVFSNPNFIFQIDEIMCENSVDALMMAYVLEAHAIEFELY